MSTLKRIAMATTIVAILLGWVPIQAALATDFTVTRTDDPSVVGVGTTVSSGRMATIS